MPKAQEMIAEGKERKGVMYIKAAQDTNDFSAAVELDK